MLPEEKLAQKVLKKYSSGPPVDVMKIISDYAKIKRLSIPISGIDGVSLNIKLRGKTSTVIVNNLISKNRQRFTLAHELVHLIIPWHIGSIIEDNINFSENNYQEQFEYEEMEREANIFAAELLLPAEWINKTYSHNLELAKFHNKISIDAQVSPIAAAIRIIHVLKDSIAFAEIDNDNIVLNYGKSTNAAVIGINRGDKIDDLFYQNIGSKSTTTIGSSTFYWWKFDKSKSIPEYELDNREWRDILNLMVNEIEVLDPKKFKQSLNGVIASANSKFLQNSTDNTIEELYYISQQRLDREDFRLIIEHKDFNIFLAKRIHELFYK